MCCQTSLACRVRSWRVLEVAAAGIGAFLMVGSCRTPDAYSSDSSSPEMLE